MTTQLDSTTQSLREALLFGALSNSDKLKENTLAESLGVSRTVIRLALGQLESEGLVTREPNKGYRVRSFTLEEVTDAILVRGELEGMAARLCAERGMEEQWIKKMRTLLVQFDTLLANGLQQLAQRAEWIELNAAFHDNLIAGSGNLILKETIDSLSKLPLVSSRAIVFDTQDHSQNLDALAGAQADHTSVIKAIVCRQGSRAENIMREHARQSAENKRGSFDAIRKSQQTPALPGILLVKQ